MINPSGPAGAGDRKVDMAARTLAALALAAALAAAVGCAKKAEEVIVVPECDCDEPCPDCVCEKEGNVGGTAGTAETPTFPGESGPK